MNTYCVYLPPNGDADQSGARFLVDGNSVFAVLAPPLWLAWHRLWWALTVYIAVLVILVLLTMTGLRDGVIFLLALPGFYLMLEGNEIIRRQYEKNGWRFTGVVQANNLADAELRYFMQEPDDQPHPLSKIPKPAMAPQSHSQKPQPQSQPQSAGLFPLGGD